MWQTRLITWIGAGSILLVAAMAVQEAMPSLLVYAPSASLPKGWYIRDVTQRPLATGDLVVVTMPEQLWTVIEGQRLPHRLLKHVAAGVGDQVCWETDAMTVSTAMGAAVYPYHVEALRMQQPQGCHTITAGELLLVGTHPRSFDSRYIGVVDGQLLQFRVHPLWTWEAA